MDIIAGLNRNLAITLAGINQSFLHARILRHQGLPELGEHFYKRSIRLMKEADALIERILMLHGAPNVADMGKVDTAERIETMLNYDQDLESRRHAALKKTIAQCEESQDYVTRVLCAEQLDSNEEYLDWLGVQQDLLNKLGRENYLQTGM